MPANRRARTIFADERVDEVRGIDREPARQACKSASEERRQRSAGNRIGFVARVVGDIVAGRVKMNDAASGEILLKPRLAKRKRPNRLERSAFLGAGDVFGSVHEAVRQRRRLVEQLGLS